MPPVRTILMLSATVFLLPCIPYEAAGDIIKFKRGTQKKCVIVEESEDSVRFLTPMGMMGMPRSMIESIKRESEEINDALEEQWSHEKKKPEKEPEAEPQPEEEKPQPSRTYTVDIKMRAVALGRRSAGLTTEEMRAVALGRRSAGLTTEEPEALLVIKDFGMVEGRRLFQISVTSFKSTSSSISAPDFHVLLTNDARVDPRPLEGYAELDATVLPKQTASGYVAFPTAAKLHKMVVKSDLTEFELDLETGKFTTRRGPF
jgi:hypothetical protein